MPKPTEEKPQQAGRARPDWRSGLDEADLPLFDALRNWRNEEARREGLSPFVLLTNRQLAEIARSRPRSLDELKSLPGFGERRLARTGQPVLDLVSRVLEGEPFWIS